MLILSGLEEMEVMEDVEAMDGYGSWLTDRLGQTGAGVAIGAGILGAGYAAINLGIGQKTSDIVNRITNNTTAGKIASAMAPAAATLAVGAIIGQPGQTGPSPEEIQAIQAAQTTKEKEASKPVSPWIPLGIIATIAGGWFAFKG